MNTKTAQLHQQLRAIGYEEAWTGGGCKAFQRFNSDNTLQVMITDENGAHLPHWGEDIVVGFYPMNGDGDTYLLVQGMYGYRAISSKTLPQEVSEIMDTLDATGEAIVNSNKSGGRKAELLRRLNAQRTGVEMHVASLETKNFNFDAYGSSLNEARTALELALVRHAEQYNLNEDWADDFAEDVVETIVVLGEGYRDRECITGNLK